MNKKTLGRIAAASLAAMTAVSAMSVTASAMIGNNGIASGSVYAVAITTPGSTGDNGVTTPATTQTVYYTSAATANAAIDAAVASGKTATSTETTVNAAFGNGVVIYVDANGKITRNNTAGTRYTTSGTSSSSSTTGTGYQYASNNNVIYKAGGLWFPSLSSMRAAGYTSYTDTATLTGNQTYANAVANFGSSNIYFDQVGGQYMLGEPNTANYIKIIGYESSSANNYYGYNYGVFRVGSTYYPTYSSALAAAAGVSSYVETLENYSAPKSNYFSRVTGQYYSTYAAALSASRNSSSNVVTLSYYNTNNSYYGDYWLDYYGYGYGDPYYYYWLQKQNEKSSDTTTSSKNDTSTATVGNRKGWTAIARYLSSLKSGSSVSVSMNYETTVPSTVLSAIKGKNITVKFVLKNGVVFTVNGNDVSVASDVNIDTAYNTNMIPSKLVKAAYKKNNAVSSAQITISSSSFGFDADVTVKFATKRAGCTAKLYRYNSSRDTLSLVDTATVQSNGKCTFGDVDKGGNFVITLS
ncbi:MAG: hypothetical protein HDT21_06385 [Ruminococcus sp.]|nr:hypothetical protein [Ruminococcus sp.]